MSIASRPRPAAARPRLREDRGSVALETAIIAPVFLVLLGLLVGAARVQLATGAADSAAKAAAREASLQRDPASAHDLAHAAAQASLANSGLQCSDTRVVIDASGINTGPGQAATVSAEVACTVPLSDVAVPGVPGAKVLSSSFSATVDRYRAAR